MRGDGAARVIENVAASVADGVRVDWDGAGAQVSGREARVIRHLRLIDSVATVYRTLPALEQEAGIDATPSPDHPAGPRWGRLLLLDRIGSGTSADVYRAWDAELQRDVALKLLRDDAGSDAAANARLLQEARRLARVKHPHVVNVYGAERHESRIGLWMELVRGRTLDEIVRREGPFAVAEAAYIGIDLCSALAAVHDAGLLHRDVKAQNVVREETGRTVLMDFGTGEEQSHGKPRLAGTPLYLAPEVLAGEAATVQTDLYGVGVLLFYLVTGKFPVEGDSLDGIADAHRARRARTLGDVRADVPDGFARVVDRALAPDPGARFASAPAMEAALRQAIASASRKPSARLSWGFAAATAAAVIALIAVSFQGTHRSTDAREIRSLAVLPLKVIAPDKNAPFLADGLTDQLITTLGQVRSLRVTAYQSVARFKGSTQSAADVARQLGVDGIVEGTVAFQPGIGGRLSRARVNVRVIRAGDDFEVWSGSLDRPIGDMLALEQDLARAITRQIRGALSADGAVRPTQAHVTPPEAEQAYFEGRAHLAQFATHAGLALAAFKRALAIDPEHAGAHAGAARSYIALGFDRVMLQPEARASALAEATRALDLDADLADAHGVLADILFFFDWDWSGAEREYQRALALDESAAFTRGQYAQFLAAMNRPAEAERQVADAVRLNPLSADAAALQAMIFYYGRRYDDAARVALHALQLDPGLLTGRFLLGRIYEAQGRIDDAVAATDEAIRAAPTVSLGWRVQALRLEALKGDTKQAREAFQALRTPDVAESLDESPQEAYLRVVLGEPDAAMRVLDRAVRHRDPGVLWMNVDPRLDPIRRRPDFAALLARTGLPPH